MTRYIPFILLIISGSFIVVSCSKTEHLVNNEALIHERDSLLYLAINNQAEIERMTSFFNEVAACIDSINEQEQLLAVQVDVETNRRYSQREITQRLNHLSEIILNQRARISSLLDSLNNGVDSVRISGLRSTITFLTAQLAEKEAQISRLKAEISGQQRSIHTLNERVSTLTAEVGELSAQNIVLTEAVQVQTEIINEGYILVATKQELKDMGVIESGGLFRKSKTNLANVKPSQCTKVNISVFNELPLPSSKFKILSPAPETSYRVRKQGNSVTLVIIDPNSFWSLSNILVIQL